MSETQTDLGSFRNAQLRELAPFYDIPLQVSVEIGQFKLRLGDLIKLVPDAVLGLKKTVGEPLDVCINGNHVARGEVMAVEQNSGVRIVEILKLGSGMAVEP